MVEETSLISPSVDKNLVPNLATSLTGYYRSKLHNSSIGLNQLVTAAQPLLALIERLKSSELLPNFDSLKDNFNHELNAFVSKPQPEQYSQETVLLARYALSATLDETLVKCHERLNTVINFQAFTVTSADGIGPEQHFFNILDKAIEHPSKQLDLLELLYLCLSIGFEGKYHGMINGHQLLEDKIDFLYQTIAKHRVSKPLDLFKKTIAVTSQPKKEMRKKPLLIAVSVTVSLLLLSALMISQQSLHKRIDLVMTQHYSSPTKVG